MIPPMAICQPKVPMGPGGTRQSIDRTTRTGMATATTAGVSRGVPAGIVAVKCRISVATAAYVPGGVNP